MSEHSHIYGEFGGLQWQLTSEIIGIVWRVKMRDTIVEIVYTVDASAQRKPGDA